MEKSLDHRENVLRGLPIACANSIIYLRLRYSMVDTFQYSPLFDEY